MKKIFLLLLCAFFSISLFAQQTTDVIYLKNGSIIRGTIIEQIIGESVKIQTTDGSVFVYKMAEIEKIEKEEASKSKNITSTPKIQPVVQTQTPYVKPKAHRFGIKAGYVHSWVTMKATMGGESENFSSMVKSHPGFEVGALYEYRSGDQMGLETGLSYINKGYKFEPDATNVMDMSLGYVSASVGYNVYFGKKKHFNVGLAYNFDFMVRAQGDITTNAETVSGDTKDIFKKFDMGLTWVVGYYGFNIGLNIGLLDIYSNKYSDGVAANSGGGIQSKFYEFKVGYTYKF